MVTWTIIEHFHEWHHTHTHHIHSDNNYISDLAQVAELWSFSGARRGGGVIHLIKFYGYMYVPEEKRFHDGMTQEKEK